MNKKGQGMIQSLIMVFIVGLILLLLSVTIVPVFNTIYDSQVPALNTMTNYNTFAAILGMVPVLLVIGGVIYILYYFTNNRQQQY